MAEMILTLWVLIVTICGGGWVLHTIGSKAQQWWRRKQIAKIMREGVRRESRAAFVLPRQR